MSYDLVILNPFLHPDLMIYPHQPLVPNRLVPAYRQELRLGAGAYTGRVAAQFMRRVSYLDWVGDDVFGEFTMAQLRALDHNTDLVHRYHGDHMVCVSVVDDESQGGTMFATYPMGWRRSFAELAAGVAALPVAGDCYLYSWFWSFAHPELLGAPTSELIESLAQTGSRIWLDPNWKPPGAPPEPDRSELLAALGSIDVLLPNVRDAEHLVGAHDPVSTVRRLLQLGPKLVVLTCGDQGVYWGSVDSESVFSLPALPVTPVDTTGAGDSFGGALVAGRGELDEIVAVASVVAGNFVAGTLPDGPLPDVSLLDAAATLLSEKREHR